VGPGHEFLKKWDERIGGGRLHPHMEMTGEGCCSALEQSSRKRALDIGRHRQRGCRRYSGELQDKAKNKSAQGFYRMASQPVERFKARDSSGKSAARQ
jgi:hypothetical protein